MYIFDEETLKRNHARYVAEQKATGHPKAIRNADFIGEAILDFLQNSPELIKNVPAPSPVIKKASAVPDLIRPDTSIEKSTETKPQTPKTPTHNSEVSPSLDERIANMKEAFKHLNE